MYRNCYITGDCIKQSNGNSKWRNILRDRNNNINDNRSSGWNILGDTAGLVIDANYRCDRSWSIYS
jgi:hypothetical protein